MFFIMILFRMEQKAFNFNEIVEKIKSRLAWAKEINGKKVIVSLGIKKETYNQTLMGLWASILVVLGLVGYLFYQNSNLNSQLDQLNRLATYDLASTRSNELLSDFADVNSIDQMVDYYDDAVQVKNKIAAELSFKRSVYSDFLRNLLLPSLNIWKNPYTKEINLSILGREYLDKNPYQDVALLTQWSSIIRDSGQNIGVNEVVNMVIEDMVEEENGFFHIPINIEFKSDSKRAFLLLVDKLSQTSNINNIGLVNDFTFYLFEEIRAEKEDEIKKLVQQYRIPQLSGEDDRIYSNKVISQYLYEMIHTGDTQSNLLIDNALIDKVIKNSASCTKNETRESCYFRFRDKYRDLPALAYTIGQKGGGNKALQLKEFYANIPPLIVIDSFTFDEAEDTGITLAEQGAYVGNVSFKIYGRGITSEDANQISSLLSVQCYGSGKNEPFTLETALQKVNDQLSIVSGRSASALDSKGTVSKIANLIELKEDLEADINHFATLQPYQQIIKKIEVSRSLKNLGICQAK